MLLRSTHSHKYSSRRCADLLVEFGASVTVSDTLDKWSPLHYGAQSGSIPTLTLLLEVGAREQLSDSKENALLRGGGVDLVSPAEVSITQAVLEPSPLVVTSDFERSSRALDLS